MATYEAVNRRRSPGRLDPTSQQIIEADASTPRILIHQAGIPPASVSDDRVAANDQTVHAGQWQEGDNNGPRLSSYVFAGTPSQSSLRIGTSAIHDSPIKSYTPIGLHHEGTPSSSSPSFHNTSAGAQSDFRHGRELKVRRSATFFYHNEDAVVQSPVDDSARGGAQPPDESKDDALDSANTSFDSSDSFYDEARRLDRPYTASLGLPPTSWDQGLSPEPSDVISDAGDQQELKLRQKQGNLQDSTLNHTPNDIEVSLASLPEECHNDLQTRIYGAFQQTRKAQSEFLPRGMLCKLVNPHSVAQELKQKCSDILIPEEDINRYAEQICNETEIRKDGRTKIKSFRKVFALLVIIECTKYILQLLKEDVSDLDLPLTMVKHDGIDGLCRRDPTSRNAGVPLKCLRRPQWSLTKLRDFARDQWIFSAPFFAQDLDSDVKHYKLDDKHILPFVDLDDMADDDSEREGGFGRVILVDIHPDHHDFGNDGIRGKGFAVKQQMYEDHRNSFKKEIDILKKFSGERSHPHIVSLLATYEQFKKFHLIFNRAEGDLFTFWGELKLRPEVTQRNIVWMVEQCRGIADGLMKLHKLLTLPRSRGGAQEETPQDSNELSDQAQPQVHKGKGVKFSPYINERVRTDSWERPASPICAPDSFQSTCGAQSTPARKSQKEDESHAKKYGRHGDITPGNILWFDDGTSEKDVLTGTLKLADFGQAELHSSLSKTQHKNVANTVTYRPPECDLQHKTIRQSYDIWCLGCVYLEFAAWMLGGHRLVMEFSLKRLSPDVLQHNIQTSTFFQVTINNWTRTPEVVVKKSVTDFIDDLHRHPLCADYIHELLNMIQNKMLIIESGERKSCEVIWKCLDEMHQKCLDDADYATSRNPWCIGRASVPRAVGLEHLNVSKDVEQVIERFLPLRPRHARHPRRSTPGRVERRTARS